MEATMKKIIATLIFAMVVGISATPASAERLHAPEPSFDRVLNNFFNVLLDPRDRYGNHQRRDRRWNQRRNRPTVEQNGWQYAGALPRRARHLHGNNCHRVTKIKRVRGRGRNKSWKRVNAVMCYNRFGNAYIARGSRRVVNEYAGRRHR
jgi:hypothetical protein